MTSVSRSSRKGSQATAITVRDVTAAARPLGLQPQILAVSEASAFDGVFIAMMRKRGGPPRTERLADLATRYRLPSMYAVKESVEAGGLMSYGPSFAAAFRRAAVFVDEPTR